MVLFTAFANSFQDFDVLKVLNTCFVVFVVYLVFSFVLKLQTKLRIAKGLAPLSGPKGVFMLGLLPDFFKNNHRIYEYLEDLIREHGGRMKTPWHLFFDGGLYTTKAEDVQYILHTNFNNYIKPQGFIDAFYELFGGSFFVMNHSNTKDQGLKWKIQRKIAAKVFTTKHFRLYTEQVFNRYAKETIALIHDSKFRIDMQEIAAIYSLKSIFVIGFGIELKEITDPQTFGTYMNYINEHCASRMFVKQHYKLFWWAMPSEYKLKFYINQVRAIADKILRKRIQETDKELEEKYDILSLFLKRLRELAKTNDPIEKEEAKLLDLDTLRSIILTFIVAGRDTTAESITYTFYMLAKHPQVQKKILEELEQETATSTTSHFDFEEMKKFKYLDASLHEALRLFPPLPYNLKMAVQDDYLPDGTFVPAGTDVAYSAWCMGRDEKRWKNPLEYRPERWIEMNKRPSAYEFPVFQAGPRICLGMNLAILEAKLFTAEMLLHFAPEIIGEQERGYVLKSGLFMRDGLPLLMKPRADKS